MIDVDVTKLSSKGQIVIPQDLREGFKVGDKFVVIRKGSQLVLKPVGELGGNFLEDLDFARKTLEALKRYEKGEFREAEELEKHTSRKR